MIENEISILENEDINVRRYKREYAKIVSEGAVNATAMKEINDYDRLLGDIINGFKKGGTESDDLIMKVIDGTKKYGIQF